jgi:hypothetical protein
MGNAFVYPERPIELAGSRLLLVKSQEYNKQNDDSIYKDLTNDESSQHSIVDNNLHKENEINKNLNDNNIEIVEIETPDKNNEESSMEITMPESLPNTMTQESVTPEPNNTSNIIQNTNNEFNNSNDEINNVTIQTPHLNIENETSSSNANEPPVVQTTNENEYELRKKVNDEIARVIGEEIRRENITNDLNPIHVAINKITSVPEVIDVNKEEAIKKIFAENSLDDKDSSFLKSKYAFDVDSFMNSLAQFNEPLSSVQLAAFRFASFAVGQCVDFINTKKALDLSLSLMKHIKQILTNILVVIFEKHIIQLLNDKRFDYIKRVGIVSSQIFYLYNLYLIEVVHKKKKANDAIDLEKYSIDKVLPPSPHPVYSQAPLVSNSIQINEDEIMDLNVNENMKESQNNELNLFKRLKNKKFKLA